MDRDRNGGTPPRCTANHDVESVPSPKSSKASPDISRSSIERATLTVATPYVAPVKAATRSWNAVTSALVKDVASAINGAVRLVDRGPLNLKTAVDRFIMDSSR
ncbi:hypothetical protein [Thiococcus pfennigii]|jgi:hypothetical protein|uniref:hypothetical protein n=1 Tax=Thiococcus pfennigii TaxID=1057 RepID=UPI0019083231|nr:hypothetical protein [Thiococcus pfennigii]